MCVFHRITIPLSVSQIKKRADKEIWYKEIYMKNCRYREREIKEKYKKSWKIFTVYKRNWKIFALIL